MADELGTDAGLGAAAGPDAAAECSSVQLRDLPGEGDWLG